MESKKLLLKIGLVVVLLAACPYTRNTFLYQGNMALGNMNQPRFIRSAPIPRLEKSLPKNLDEALVVAYYESSRNKSTGAYWKILEKFPNEPALYANMLRYEARYSQFGWLYKRPEISHKASLQPWKPLPDTPESRKYEHAIKMGQKLEPDNIYFDLFEAALRFSQGRDDEALAVLHKAAGKKHYISHQPEETSAVINDVCRRAPVPLGLLDQIRRLVIRCAVIFPEYSSFQQSARLAAWYAEMNAGNGQYDRSLAIIADLIKIGGIMRDGNETTIGVSIGGLIQKIGIGKVYHAMFPGVKGYGNQPSTDLLAAIKSVVPSVLKPDEWQALHDNLARSNEFWRRYENYCEHYYGKNNDWMKPFVANLSLMSIAGNILIKLLALGLIWLTAYIWLQKRRVSAVMAGPSRLSIWLIAVLPPVAVSALVVTMKNIGDFSMSGDKVQGWAFKLPTIGLMLLTPVIVAVIAAARTRIGPEVGRLDTFLSRLRAGSVYAIQALVVLYILVMIALVPVTEKARIMTDRMVSNEVQAVWEFQPPDSK